MWIFCCGMKRSGSTLQYQLATALVERQNRGRAFGWIEPDDFAGQLAEVGAAESAPDLLVGKSHRYFEAVEPLFAGGQAKGLYIYRDARDVVVSIMKMIEQPFDELIRDGFIETILQDYQRWTALPNVMVSQYEKVMPDVLGETLRIAQFLGIEVDEATAREIAEAHSLSQQQQKIKSFDYSSQSTASSPYQWDPQSLLHSNHIRSGASEQWRSELSPAQIALVEQMAGDWLQGHGYALSSSWLERKTALAAHLKQRVTRVARSSNKETATDDGARP